MFFLFYFTFTALCARPKRCVQNLDRTNPLLERLDGKSNTEFTEPGHQNYTTPQEDPLNEQFEFSDTGNYLFTGFKDQTRNSEEYSQSSFLPPRLNQFSQIYSTRQLCNEHKDAQDYFPITESQHEKYEFSRHKSYSYLQEENVPLDLSTMSEVVNSIADQATSDVVQSCIQCEKECLLRKPIYKSKHVHPEMKFTFSNEQEYYKDTGAWNSSQFHMAQHSKPKSFRKCSASPYLTQIVEREKSKKAKEKEEKVRESLEFVAATIIFDGLESKFYDSLQDIDGIGHFLTDSKSIVEMRAKDKSDAKRLNSMQDLRDFHNVVKTEIKFRINDYNELLIGVNDNIKSRLSIHLKALENCMYETLFSIDSALDMRLPVRDKKSRQMHTEFLYLLEINGKVESLRSAVLKLILSEYSERLLVRKLE